MRDRFGPLVIPAHAGIQGNDSLFWRGVNVPKKRYQCCWILAFARMTAPPSRHARPDRASRIASPYFADVSRGGKTVFMLPGSSHTQG